MAFTSGRRRVFPASTKKVRATAWAIMSAPAQEPTAADAHSVAAVLRPRTSMPCFMMTPAPRKPIPDTTYGDHPYRAFFCGQVHREIDKGGRTHGDQYIGPQTGGPLPVLPLGADQGAENERRDEADQRIDEIGALECREKPHVRLDRLEK